MGNAEGFQVSFNPVFTNSFMISWCFPATASSRVVMPLYSLRCTKAPWWSKGCTAVKCNAVGPS